MLTEQFKTGIPKIVKNADDLCQNSGFLFSNNRLARANTLFQLLIEEIAKAFILANALIFMIQLLKNHPKNKKRKLKTMNSNFKLKILA